MGISAWLLKLAERVADRISDSLYLRIRFRRRFGWWPKVRRPQTFNEHLLRYKLTSRSDPRLPALADKLAAKAAVRAQIGEEYIIPTLWQGSILPPLSERVWPKPYILKAAHRSGANIIVHENDVEDWDAIERTCADWVGSTFGRLGREWHYGRIAPMLLVEPFIGERDVAPDDIKIQCFHGKARVVNIIQDRFADVKSYSFDLDWNRLPYAFVQGGGAEPPPRPDNLREMIHVAETLARGFEYVSVDLYNVQGRIYFGELTFTTANGMGQFHPPSGDHLLGAFWKEGTPSTHPSEPEKVTNPAPLSVRV